MALYLGIDGGGTGCRAALADGSGAILGRGSAASANIVTDPEGARRNILAAAEAALGEAGGRLEAVRAVLGLAGANVPSAVARLVEALPFGAVEVVSDSLIALKGAFGEADGIAATVGTGSIFTRQIGGAVTTIGGWGFLLGDQGSGARMGRDLLEAALLARDGLAPGSPLLTEVIEEAGGPEALVAFAQGTTPAGFAAYAPRILAAEGDAGAVAVLDRAVAAVAAAIARLQRQPPLPVAFLGGLGPIHAARLAGRLGAPIRAPLGSALDGALALARRLG